MMNCQQATRLFSDAQERQLTLKERTALKVHTMMCSGCRNFGKHIGTLRNLTHEYAKGPQTANRDEKKTDSEVDRGD